MTIVEVLIAVAIIGILATMAIPSFRETIRQQRIRSAGYDLTATLMRARSEAISRNTSVTIVPNNATNWGLGWKLNDTGGTTLSNTDKISNTEVSGPSSVVFTSSGRHTGGPSSFTVSATDATASEKRCISLGLSGMVSTRTGAC